MSKSKKKLVFYVDTECSFHGKSRCLYYSSRAIQEQASESAKKAWGGKCCPIVYAKTDRNKYTAFCPTKGGPWGEQLPTLGGPGPNAVKVELDSKVGETWAEIIERAAKLGCEARS